MELNITPPSKKRGRPPLNGLTRPLQKKFRLSKVENDVIVEVFNLLKSKLKAESETDILMYLVYQEHHKLDKKKVIK